MLKIKRNKHSPEKVIPKEKGKHTKFLPPVSVLRIIQECFNLTDTTVEGVFRESESQYAVNYFFLAIEEHLHNQTGYGGAIDFDLKCFNITEFLQENFSSNLNSAIFYSHIIRRSFLHLSLPPSFQEDIHEFDQQVSSKERIDFADFRELCAKLNPELKSITLKLIHTGKQVLKEQPDMKESFAAFFFASAFAQMFTIEKGTLTASVKKFKQFIETLYLSEDFERHMAAFEQAKTSDNESYYPSVLPAKTWPDDGFEFSLPAARKVLDKCLEGVEDTDIQQLSFVNLTPNESRVKYILSEAQQFVSEYEVTPSNEFLFKSILDVIKWPKIKSKEEDEKLINVAKPATLMNVAKRVLYGVALPHRAQEHFEKFLKQSVKLTQSTKSEKSEKESPKNYSSKLAVFLSKLEPEYKGCILAFIKFGARLTDSPNMGEEEIAHYVASIIHSAMTKDIPLDKKTIQNQLGIIKAELIELYSSMKDYKSQTKNSNILSPLAKFERDCKDLPEMHKFHSFSPVTIGGFSPLSGKTPPKKSSQTPPAANHHSSFSSSSSSSSMGENSPVYPLVLPPTSLLTPVTQKEEVFLSAISAEQSASLEVGAQDGKVDFEADARLNTESTDVQPIEQSFLIESVVPLQSVVPPLVLASNLDKLRLDDQDDGFQPPNHVRENGRERDEGKPVGSNKCRM